MCRRTGDHSEEGTPVPIPNTEVKLFSPDDTLGAAPRENKKSPFHPPTWAVLFITLMINRGIRQGGQAMPIYFYRIHEKPYGCFSNFSPHGFELDDLFWLTSEHYFQAQKFPDSPYAEAIRLAETPGRAAEMGRDHRYHLRKDWEQVKDGIMFQAVLRKFETHADIRATLLGTKDAELVERTTYDYYWGCGSDGTGKNMLGKTLVQVRSVLRERPD
jgi:N-glycosidase YbiA